MDDTKSYFLNQKIIGDLTPFCQPTIDVKIKGIDEVFKALIDTGAYKFHITPSFAKHISAIPTGFQRGIYPVSGISETNLYQLSFNLKGVDYEFNEEFVELPSPFQYPIILGSKFIKQCKELHIYSNELFYELFL
ncbi:hypothetical protein [Lutibacter sp.]|uniref:hypothetical protein n=1 Tax=Lutibacter sp. TaxID=1925666 RepID=UPI00273741F0|nr:hypothetical protein [Lutibacter sp.]MDP3313774.1 hypothetical protein [Lutibacter sp.]